MKTFFLLIILHFALFANAQKDIHWITPGVAFDGVLLKDISKHKAKKMLRYNFERSKYRLHGCRGGKFYRYNKLFISNTKKGISFEFETESRSLRICKHSCPTVKNIRRVRRQPVFKKARLSQIVIEKNGMTVDSIKIGYSRKAEVTRKYGEGEVGGVMQVYYREKHMEIEYSQWFIVSKITLYVPDEE